MEKKSVTTDFVSVVISLDRLIRSGVVNFVYIFDADENMYDEVTIFSVRPTTINFKAVLSNGSIYYGDYLHNEATDSGRLEITKHVDDCEYEFLDVFG